MCRRQGLQSPRTGELTDACRIVGDQHLLDTFGVGLRLAQGCLRRRGHALRRPSTRSHRVGGRPGETLHGRAVPVRQPSLGLDRGRRGASGGCGVQRPGLHQLHPGSAGPRRGGRLPARGVSRAARRAGDRRDFGPVRADDGRSDGHAGSSSCSEATARAVGLSLRLDDPGPHDLGRRLLRGGARGCQPVSPALGLRIGRPARDEERAGGLPRVVPDLLWPAQPVGRRGFQALCHSGRDRARTAALRDHHARRREAIGPEGPGGFVPHEAG